MSNYPNMSYCMCHNTLVALRQVMSSVDVQGTNFLMEISKEELQAYKDLYDTCLNFIEQSNDLKAAATAEWPDDIEEFFCCN